VGVGACIIASSVLKLRKCLTLFYMWARHVLLALRLKSIKLSKLSKTVSIGYTLNFVSQLRAYDFLSS